MLFRSQFQFDKWKDQKEYVEVWVEKDALIGILEQACEPLDVPYFSCRGYTSQSEMWVASQRLLEKVRAGKKVTIIHLGDHDPSGVDMSRDIEERIQGFLEHHRLMDFVEADRKNRGIKPEETAAEWAKRTKYISVESIFTLNRIALTMSQIREYDPPPNPAKLTDSRSNKYVKAYGNESWELDALEPTVLTGLIRDAVFELRDEDAWDGALEKEDTAKSQLRKVAQNWDKAVKAIK